MYMHIHMHMHMHMHMYMYMYRKAHITCMWAVWLIVHMLREIFLLEAATVLLALVHLRKSNINKPTISH